MACTTTPKFCFYFTKINIHVIVKNKNVSVSNLVTYDEEGQSPFLARYNRQKAVTISARLVGDYSLDEAKLSAASTMAIAPILILGWFSQKQLVRGLTFGAVK